MGKLIIAGLGPADSGKMTLETAQAIAAADKVILRTKIHPAAQELLAGGKRFETCDSYYEQGASFQEIYENIAEFVLDEARKYDMLCYCVPGHPRVAEETVRLILQKADMAGPEASPDIRVLPALSFLDAVFIRLGLDPVQEGLAILDAAPLSEGNRSGFLPLPRRSCLFTQVYDRFIAGELKLALLEAAPPEAEVLILYHAGVAGEDRLILCPLAELDHFKDFDHLTSVYLPLVAANGAANRLEGGQSDAGTPGAGMSAAGMPDVRITEAGMPGVGAPGPRYPLDSLIGVFDRLLGPGGCPWDRKQSHESLKPYLLEEANEVLEAIDEKDMAHLKEELGDVLMQIVFHSALAQARGDFDMNGVTAGITEKLIRRHPHVFGDKKADSPEEVMLLWQQIKAEEKGRKNP